MIQDQIAIGGGSMQSSGAATSAALTLPLFRKNIEKDRFDRAISWMKIDIEQLLTSRGKSYDQKRDILYNVANLFQCQNCPRLAM